MMPIMATAQGRPYGRRQKVSPPSAGSGTRLVQTNIRLPEALRRALHEQAAAADISASAYMARLIARDAGLPDPLATAQAGQEELPLTKAS